MDVYNDQLFRSTCKYLIANIMILISMETVFRCIRQQGKLEMFYLANKLGRQRTVRHFLMFDIAMFSMSSRKLNINLSSFITTIVQRSNFIVAQAPCTRMLNLAISIQLENQVSSFRPAFLDFAKAVFNVRSVNRPIRADIRAFVFSIVYILPCSLQFAYFLFSVETWSLKRSFMMPPTLLALQESEYFMYDNRLLGVGNKI